jgi:hypothetical protein
MLYRIGVTDLIDPACDLRPYKHWVFYQLHHLFPDEIIKVVLPDGSIGTDSLTPMAIRIRPKAPIVMDLAAGRCGKCSVEGIAAFPAHQNSLQECRFDRAPGRELFVAAKQLLSLIEGLLANKSRIIMTTENSPASMAENSPTLVKFFPRVLGRDRC